MKRTEYITQRTSNKLIKFGKQEAIKRFEKMIEEIWTINGTGCFYLKGINNNEVRRVERLKKFASQLKQEKEEE